MYRFFVLLRLDIRPFPKRILHIASLTVFCVHFHPETCWRSNIRWLCQARECINKCLSPLVANRAIDKSTPARIFRPLPVEFCGIILLRSSRTVLQHFNHVSPPPTTPEECLRADYAYAIPQIHSRSTELRESSARRTDRPKALTCVACRGAALL